METIKLTVEDLRRIPMGGTETFALPDAQAVRNGKSLLYQQQHVLGCRFTAESDFINCRLTVTKLPKQ